MLKGAPYNPTSTSVEKRFTEHFQHLSLSFSLGELCSSATNSRNRCRGPSAEHGRPSTARKIANANPPYDFFKMHISCIEARK